MIARAHIGLPMGRIRPCDDAIIRPSHEPPGLDIPSYENYIEFYGRIVVLVGGLWAQCVGLRQIEDSISLQRPLL